MTSRSEVLLFASRLPVILAGSPESASFRLSLSLSLYRDDIQTAFRILMAQC